jgi:hypothetical protein
MADKQQNAPVEKKADNTSDAKRKERAVNPRAHRPDGVNVTITEIPPAINIIKKLFGF